MPTLQRNIPRTVRTWVSQPVPLCMIVAATFMIAIVLSSAWSLRAAGVSDAWQWEQALLAGIGPMLMMTVILGVSVFNFRRKSLDNEATLYRSMENLLASEAKLSALLDNAPIGLVFTDSRGHLVRTNRAYERISGLDSESLLGLGWAKTLHPDDHDRVTQTWFSAASRGQECAIIYRQLHADGSVRWVDTSATPVVHNGLLTGYAAAVVDVTEQRQHDDAMLRFNTDLLATKAALEKHAAELSARTTELENARREADRANKAKSDFLANMSHEIRTPMTAILGYSDLLLDPSQPADQRASCVQTIRRSGHHLLALINDILDLSKIEAGRIQLELIECNPASVMQEVASLLRGKAVEKGIAFGIEFATPIPDRIRTDPTRLKQLLTNLVGNAVKFTDSGGVRMVAQMTQREDGEDLLQIVIVDTGIGIPPEQISGLFEPFRQADESMSRRFGGTGLGLAICKNLAELLGGAVKVDSVPGEGSTFTVTVLAGKVDGVAMLRQPMAPSVERPLSSMIREQAALPRLNGRVLLAEDGPDNQRLLGMLLRKAGAEVVLADNGLIAVETAQAAMKDGRPFDVVLMDMQMPVLEGYSAVSRLRAEGYTGVIVALTAHAMAADRDRCMRSGCDDYLTKPIERSVLIGAVYAWMTGQKRRADGTVLRTR